MPARQLVAAALAVGLAATAAAPALADPGHHGWGWREHHRPHPHVIYYPAYPAPRVIYAAPAYVAPPPVIVPPAVVVAPPPVYAAPLLSITIPLR